MGTGARTLRLALAAALAGLAVAAACPHAAWGQPKAPTAKAPPISEDARKHFKAGVALLQDPEGERVEDAYREFKTAYQLSPSPKILGNMGLCAMKLERDGEAIEAYSHYLREVSDIDADERAQIVRDLQTLGVGVVHVTMTIDQPDVIVSDVRIPVKGERITNVYKPENGRIHAGLRAGHHLISVRKQGFQDATWEFDALAGSKESYDFKLKPVAVAAPPPPPRRSGPSVAPWIVAGVGVAMLGGGTVTGILSLGKTKDIERACPDNVCPRGFDLAGARSSARTFVTVTDVLLIGGGIVTAGGLGWGLLFNKGGVEEKTAPSAGTRPMFLGGCTGEGCAGAVRVRF